VDVCTIIAKNYVAHARVLARSFAEHHPEGRFHVLVIDEYDGYIDPAEEPFILVTPGELDIEGFTRMAVLYDVVELSTAVKPWLLRWLLARSPDDVAVYLDPDMRLYARLDEMFAAVSEHGLVLTPHSVDPMPRDGKRPNEQDILIAGAYNLGFIGIGSGAFADELLEWWAERLETDCIVDPTRGFFVDQRWIDLVPGMAESFHLLRDRGFNVAYWNLSARPISHRPDATWYAADVPLRLFHFSGFDRTRPHLLSKHQNRISLGEHPDLARLCDLYANELLTAGAEEARDWPYTYATTASGLQLNAVMRNVYRRLVAAGSDVGSVFDTVQEHEFIDHLNAPAPRADGGEVGITNYLLALYQEREDLRRAYPDIAGADAPGYLGWARVFGKGEVPDAVCPPGGDENGAAPPKPRPRRPFGVNVAGYLNSELGVGEIARQAIHALDVAKVPVLPVGITAPNSRQGHAFAHGGPTGAGYPVNLICVNADMLPSFAAGMGEKFFVDRYTIGWWWWEVSEFPERWLDSFQRLDELWAGSRFVAEALAAVSPVPVIQIPTPVSVPGFPRREPERFDLPPQFSFLFSFDYASVLARKNPLGCITAFLRAFPQPGEAILVLKSINAEQHPGDADRVRIAASDHRHIVLLDAYLEPIDKDRLVASCDCYVSLHRSEGFGITMAEAMYLGKPVIATAYSGNLDFMTRENSYLVDYKLAPIGAGADPYPPAAEWAEPDLEHAAALMREVYSDREGARERAERGRADIRRTHSVEAAGARMAQRLHTIAAREAPSGSGWEAPAALELVERADAEVRFGAHATGGNRAKRTARRLAMRAIRPHVTRQMSIDGDVVGALQAIGRDVAQLGDRGVAVEALALRGLRDVEDRLRSLVEPELAAGGLRTDDLAQQVNDLRQTLERHGVLLSASGLPAEPVVAEYPTAPAEPWSAEYNAAHAAFVGRALDDPALLETVRRGAPLPDGYGRGFDERVVEFPWLASRSLSGRVLDAGSTLNHLHVLRRLRPRMDDLHIVTLAPEDRAFPNLGISYLFADLRNLPLRDATYDRVLSLSTLEHVGLDLEHFGADGGAAEDPQLGALAAADELCRVLQPGGTALLTVPVGVAERFDWVRSFSLEEVDALIDRFDPVEAEVTYFRHDEGWQPVDRDGVTGARYRDHLSGEAPRDGIVAAQAVACVALKIG
jgi:hypothetical protein